MKEFKVKPIINKKNGQYSISLPKKKLSKETIDLIKHRDYLKIKLL